MKWVLTVAASLFFIQMMYCEDVFVKVKEDTLVWLSGTSAALSKDNAKMTVGKGTLVEPKGVFHGEVNFGEEMSAFISKITYENMDLLIQTSMLVPDNSDLFDESLLTNIADKSRDTWVMEHYLSILLSGDRDGFEEYEREYIDSFNYYRRYQEWEEKWHDDVPTYYVDSLQLMQTYIRAGGFMPKQFCIFNIKKSESGYTIMVFDNRDNKNNVLLEDQTCIIPFPKGREIFELLLVYDNDYMDMYLDSKDTHIATFVKINKTIQGEIINLMRDNYCDLSKITYWPRRADGSMDYPPPQPTQAAIPEQPETADTADYGEAAEPDLVEETVGRQTVTGFPWVIVLIIAGIALVGATAFVVLRKKR